MFEHQFVRNERALAEIRRDLRSGIPCAVMLDRVVLSEKVVCLLRIEPIRNGDSPRRRGAARHSCMTVHEEIGATLAPLHDLTNVVERGSLVAGVCHGDIIEGDDLVVGMPEVRHFIAMWSDGEHTGEVVADLTRFVDVAHGRKKIAADGGGWCRCGHANVYARTTPGCDAGTSALTSNW